MVTCNCIIRAGLLVELCYIHKQHEVMFAAGKLGECAKAAEEMAAERYGPAARAMAGIAGGLREQEARLIMSLIADTGR